MAIVGDIIIGMSARTDQLARDLSAASTNLDAFGGQALQAASASSGGVSARAITFTADWSSPQLHAVRTDADGWVSGPKIGRGWRSRSRWAKSPRWRR